MFRDVDMDSIIEQVLLKHLKRSAAGAMPTPKGLAAMLQDLQKAQKVCPYASLVCVPAFSLVVFCVVVLSAPAAPD